eukprot:9174830-Alexandrium_andersonii.AAC.1
MAATERLAAPLGGAPSCCVKASSPMEPCASGDSSDGAASSLCGGGPPLPKGRVCHSGAAGAPAQP